MLRRLLLLVSAAAGLATGAAAGAAAATLPVLPAALGPPATLLTPMPGVAPPFRLPDRLPAARATYRTPAQHAAELDRLITASPGIARRVVLPRPTVAGRPIVGVELAGGVERTDDGRPMLVVLGTVHAREWASGEVALDFAQDLAAGWATDARIRALLDRVRVLVVPVVNVDGFALSRTDPRRRLRRTNLQGVDLNRNAGTRWGGPGTSPNLGDQTYRGTGPWSAPEAAAIHELLRTRPVTAVVGLHSVAGVVLHPPGVAGVPRTPDERVAASLARAMGAAAGYAAGRVDRVLYEVTGSIEDWAFSAQGALAATIEVGGRGFFGPYARNVTDQYLGRASTTPRRRSRTPHGGVREALLLAAQAAADPTRHGTFVGTAPPGATLTATRRFATTTDATPRSIPDGVTTAVRVDATGRFTWQLGPSTRPASALAGRPEAWTVTCTVAGRETGRMDVVLARGARVLIAPCATRS